VICQDEMTESADVETFQKRLWDMFPIKFKMQLSLPQIDRIRWHMFPEVRIPAQHDMFAESGQTATPVGRSNSPTFGHFKFPHPDERLMAQ
jgi:hypothetical protein